MGWRSFVYPQVVTSRTSDYNADIRVIESWGKLKLLVNGSPQSGPYIESLWKRVFRHYSLYPLNRFTDVLLLGIGGGTVIHLLRAESANCKITAIDIDKQMVSIGRAYFGLQESDDLKLIVSDARNFLDNISKSGKLYNLVIVDLFIGRHIPEFVASVDFLTKIRKLTEKNGFVLINYLRENDYAIKSERLLDKLRNIFHSVYERKIFLNRFFICRV